MSNNTTALLNAMGLLVEAEMRLAGSRGPITGQDIIESRELVARARRYVEGVLKHQPGNQPPKADR